MPDSFGALIAPSLAGQGGCCASAPHLPLSKRNPQNAAAAGRCRHAVCPTPCLNNGTCRLPATDECTCPPGTTGKKCETLGEATPWGSGWSGVERHEVPSLIKWPRLDRVPAPTAQRLSCVGLAGTRSWLGESEGTHFANGGRAPTASAMPHPAARVAAGGRSLQVLQWGPGQQLPRAGGVQLRRHQQDGSRLPGTR